MTKAEWNGKIVADSDKCIEMEGNQYFPPDSVRMEFFKDSGTHSTCPWKGEASYYDVVVDGKVNKDAAWYYPDPSPAAIKIKGHIAFWNGVKIKT